MVAIEGDVQQELRALSRKPREVQRHIVVHLVDSQSYVERLHLLVVCQHLDISYLLPFLYGQQQIAVLHIHTQHGMALA